MDTEILSKLDELLALQHQLVKLCRSLNQPLPPEEWLDNADVKNLLKISDSSLYRLRKNKLLPATQIAGKWYYAKLDIAKIIES
ncbi:MAG: DNA-binding protein [Pedobacter sp.]|nr:MAG: DNA-binding protein [Pedobacter sp.]